MPTLAISRGTLAAYQVILDKYALFTQSGETEVVYNWFQCFDRDSLQQELSDAGLKTQAVYADVCGQKYNSGSIEFAVIAQRANLSG